MTDEDERDDERDASTDDAPADAGEPTSSDEDDAGSDDPGSASAGDASPSATAEAEKAHAKSAAKAAASAGARLAAAKAAKAAAKAAKKQARRDEAGATQSAAERAAQDREQVQSAEDVLKGSPLGRAATRAGEWTAANRQMAIGAVAIAAIALVGWIGWSMWSGREAVAAGGLLTEALRISSAEIVSAAAPAAQGDGDADEDDAPTFETIAARNDAALAAYRRVVTEYGGSRAAAWARLGEGRTLLAQGQYDGARTAYQAAFDSSGDETVVAWQALEGIGATYEAESEWAHATSTYERLSSLADHAYQSVASYHLARMRAASGDEAAALTAFRELVDTLRDQDEEGEPPFPYVLAQADQRLRELDPSAVGAGPSAHGGGPTDEEGGNPLEGLSPEEIQQLIQRMQTKSGGSPLPE